MKPTNDCRLPWDLVGCARFSGQAAPSLSCMPVASVDIQFRILYFIHAPRFHFDEYEAEYLLTHDAIML
ncbi:MAG: hypothetical protein KKD14_04415 [Verrucomicrobia bacterium]|nr:hypothetical protein [Verrucomicrobiota bacterium]MBU4247583.1 hypothetical protein [Verrucomicrobiota bacterium]MBU4291197.1 hypothetical protein [Verrucomicrobiota bacterium]MCG2679057.1 hypothetical protein [Kiritimatiellia bacterium]